MNASRRESLPRPLLVGHRGAAARAPENTAAAIRAAARAGAHMVELDVQMTRDGRLVLLHDRRLGRTTSGTGTVRAARYRELAQLDAGAWFHPRFSGERILLAAQALRLARRRRLWVNLELKRTARRERLLLAVKRLLRRLGTRRLLLSSFDPALLRPLGPHRRALIASRQADRSLRQAARLGCVAWHPHHALLTPARILRAHQAGLRVHAWTVGRAALARRLLRWGVDGVFSDDPGRLARWIRGRRP